MVLHRRSQNALGVLRPDADLHSLRRTEMWCQLAFGRNERSKWALARFEDYRIVVLSNARDQRLPRNVAITIGQRHQHMDSRNWGYGAVDSMGFRRTEADTEDPDERASRLLR